MECKGDKRKFESEANLTETTFKTKKRLERDYFHTIHMKTNSF